MSTLAVVHAEEVRELRVKERAACLVADIDTNLPLVALMFGPGAMEDDGSPGCAAARVHTEVVAKCSAAATAQRMVWAPSAAPSRGAGPAPAPEEDVTAQLALLGEERDCAPVGCHAKRIRLLNDACQCYTVQY